MAVCVGLAFDRLKEKIVREFVATLCSDLRRRLGKAWDVDDGWSEAPLDEECYISVHKKQWVGDVHVGLGCSEGGLSDLFWSVWPENESLNATQSATIKAALDKLYAPGRKHGAINSWWQRVDKPYRDWNTEEALIGLWKSDEALNGFWNKEEAVEYYASNLVKIAKIADTAI
jgi:hypothetical protein